MTNGEPALSSKLCLGFIVGVMLFDPAVSLAMPHLTSGRSFAILAPQPTPDDLKSLLLLFPEDQEVQQAIKKLVKKKLAIHEDSLEDAAFEILATNWLGRIVFFMVHVIVCVGTWFAIAEFLAAQRLRDTASTQTQHDVTVSLQGIAVKSSLHGMALLSIAFAFYLLYLKYVHPVVVLSNQSDSGSLG